MSAVLTETTLSQLTAPPLGIFDLITRLANDGRSAVIAAVGLVVLVAYTFHVIRGGATLGKIIVGGLMFGAFFWFLNNPEKVANLFDDELSSSAATTTVQPSPTRPA